MIEELKGTLRELAGSKKAVLTATAGIIYVLVRLAGHFHIAIDPAVATEIADRIVALGVVAVGGQAVADHGKEAAQVNADAMNAPAPPAATAPPK